MSRPLLRRLPVNQAELRRIRPPEDQPIPERVEGRAGLRLQVPDEHFTPCDATPKAERPPLEEFDMVEGDEGVRHRAPARSRTLGLARFRRQAERWHRCDLDERVSWMQTVLRGCTGW